MHPNGGVAGNSRGTKPPCAPCLQVMLQSVNAERHMPNPFAMLSYKVHNSFNTAECFDLIVKKVQFQG